MFGTDLPRFCLIVTVYTLFFRENLPVEEVVHPAEDKTCPACGREMEHVGKEFVRDEVVYSPARMFVRKHYVEVVKCPSCGKDESLDASLPDVAAPVFGKATVPSPVIPRSYCSPELLAHIIYQKYAQAVPLYRQAGASCPDSGGEVYATAGTNQARS